MISAVTGYLQNVSDERVLLSVGPFVLELLIPASDVDELKALERTELTFNTILYLEGDSSGGNSEPRLLGFLKADDKRFFEKFITVKGIGPRKALRALKVPAGEIAYAIESKDARRLSTLPGIGKRTAEQIIAELSGKVQEFAVAGVEAEMNGASNRGSGKGATGTLARTPAEEDAILTLLTLGERRSDAEALLERARTSEPSVKTTDGLVRVMLMLRTSRVS